MFSKASNKSNQPSLPSDGGKAPAKKAGVPSIISPDLRVNGDLVCSGDIQIDGWIEGDIQSRNVVVGEGATVHGAVQAENVRICGIVNGQIRADNVTLEKSARVTGDILHKSLSIEQGAFLEGMCKRIDTSPAIPQIEPRPAIAKDTTPRDKVAALGSPEPHAAVN
ncbi:MAG TPA: polymer-forming cytoskeletal protein [Dongiaceae bacterium]|jgi:cytoskeletal protein CcmA (bactofilin family)|nr:polymer-forming cytoskeletal protein [Dongiaceae bacterium]